MTTNRRRILRAIVAMTCSAGKDRPADVVALLLVVEHASHRRGLLDLSRCQRQGHRSTPSRGVPLPRPHLVGFGLVVSRLRLRPRR